MALKADNDVPLPENIQAKDKIYPPVISLVSPYNAGDCTRRRRHEIDDVDARRKLDQFLTLAKSNTLLSPGKLRTAEIENDVHASRRGFRRDGL